MPSLHSWWQSVLPDSLQGRIVGLMTISVALAQVVGTLLWARQTTQTASHDAKLAAQGIAVNAAETLRYFHELPLAHRPIVIEQQRAMGGARFFINANARALSVQGIATSPLANAVTQQVGQSIKTALPGILDLRVNFAWPNALVVDDQGSRLDQLPRTWVAANLVLAPKPAPILVVQAEFEPHAWLLLATTMPDPYFLEAEHPITPSVAWLQMFTLVIVMALTALLMRKLIRPLNQLAHAANTFGQGVPVEPLTESGSAEVRRTARAFNAMQDRIQRYVQERQRLFVDISHSLKTPITRLKLRTEMLDDDELRAGFHDDLDDLDLMVKSALQSVRDADIHENQQTVNLEQLLTRLARRAIYPQATVNLSLWPCLVMGKPLALMRALGNLLDNAVVYGKQVNVSLQDAGHHAVIEMRDCGPGIAPEALDRVFEPHVRLLHGQREHASGSGLGLGISRTIIEAHGGQLQLRNHPQGGLIVHVQLPKAPDLIG